MTWPIPVSSTREGGWINKSDWHQIVQTGRTWHGSQPFWHCPLLHFGTAIRYFLGPISYLFFSVSFFLFSFFMPTCVSCCSTSFSISKIVGFTFIKFVLVMKLSACDTVTPEILHAIIQLLRGLKNVSYFFFLIVLQGQLVYCTSRPVFLFCF